MACPVAVRFHSAVELASGAFVTTRSPKVTLPAPPPVPGAPAVDSLDQPMLRASIVPPGPSPGMPVSVRRPAGARLTGGATTAAGPAGPAAPSRPGSPL